VLRALVLRISTLLITLACFGPAADVTAYQAAGHYYTIAALTHLVAPAIKPADAHLIAFCAQLPDLSSDLDATAVYKSALWHTPGAWLSWARSNKVESDWIRRMITVQQLLHGITGGTASEVQTVAINTLKALWKPIVLDQDPANKRAVSLCALGFAFHLYGDSFAHQMMGDHGKPDFENMYSTGMGHARDLYYPDLPLCAHFASAPRIFRHCDTGNGGRFDRWQTAWVKAAEYLGAGTTNGAMPPDAVKATTEKLLTLDGDASDSNDWNEIPMESMLAGFVALTDADSTFFLHHLSDTPCEKVVADAIKSLLSKSDTSFRCADVWSLYYQVAEKEFSNNVRARANLGFQQPSGPYMTPLLP
jgi:hypothetical protein